MIEVISVSKSYGNVVSLSDISFNIRQGEIFGLLGPNGAGKSTTVNILNTLIVPDSGQVYIDGIDLLQEPDRCKVAMGVVPQEIALYDNLSAFDNMIFWGGLYNNISKSELRERAMGVLDLVGLTGRKDDKIRTFSGGMKRRINISCSLLHNPKILILDEPTAGVDPQNRNHIFDLVERLKAKGITIIYTTHYMQEAERLCDSIAIIDSGTIRAFGTLKELREISGATDVITFRLSGLDEEGLKTISNSVPYNVISSSVSTIQIECDNLSNDISGIISLLQQAGAVIEGFDAHEANLESVFLRLTGKNLRD